MRIDRITQYDQDFRAMNPPSSRFLTPRDLALAVGASESSLKRWIDEGVISASRTAGGHRRILLAEAIRFIRESRSQVVRPELLGIDCRAMDPRGEGRLTDDLVAAMRAGDGRSVGVLVVSAFLAGMSVAEVCDGPIRGSLTIIGELWRHGAEGIAIEHQAVEACSQALGAIRLTLPEPPAEAPVALGGAVAGDPYVLPTLIASIVLREVGYRSVNLGPDLPAEALLHGIARHRPALVWRSASIASDARELRREVEAIETTLRTRSAELVLGGRGLAVIGVPRTERCHAFPSMAGLAGFARGLVSARAPTTAG
jgi:methanogenic corrinoid protein MtbC1